MPRRLLQRLRGLVESLASRIPSSFLERGADLSLSSTMYRCNATLTTRIV